MKVSDNIFIGNILFVDHVFDSGFILSNRNFKNIQRVFWNNLNVMDVVKNDFIVISKVVLSSFFSRFFL